MMVEKAYEAGRATENIAGQPKLAVGQLGSNRSTNLLPPTANANREAEKLSAIDEDEEDDASQT